MRANRQSDTKPELSLRSGLHRRGYRFRKHLRIRTGSKSVSVDIAFPKERLAVFVDGCFWHQCPEHGSVPSSNEAYWFPKLARNVARDERVTKTLEASGWAVLRIWEHEPADEAVAVVAAKLSELRRHTPSTALDLFAGAGGSTEGLKAAEYRVLGAVECDASAARSYSSNHPDVLLFDRDIRDVSPRTMRYALGIKQGELDLLNACPPCQGFSSLGTGSPDDPRNDLVLVVRSFLADFRPKAFVLENVPGLHGDRRLQNLLDFARASDYGVRAYVVNATTFGVPQTRRRLVVIGVLGLDEGTLPNDMADLLPSTFHLTPPSVSKVLAKAGPIERTDDPLHHARQSSARVLARIRQIPRGGDRFDLPEAHQLACHKKLKGRSATAAYGRIRLDRPAPTLTTRCTTPACGRFVHPTEDRGISLREAALLQTFPRGYRFHGTHQSLEAQIGNAVPVRMAQAIGLAVGTLTGRGTRA